MTNETLRYDLWVEEALRSVIKKTLTQVAEHGLPGDHHFYISFLTQDNGVEIPGHLRAQHPVDMTIVLQHQFENLVIDEDSFSVSLRFGGKLEQLSIPYVSVISFADPSVNFALQLKMMVVDEDDEQFDGEVMDIHDFSPSQLEDDETAFSNSDDPDDDQKANDDTKKSGEVITLDAFRKK